MAEASRHDDAADAWSGLGRPGAGARKSGCAAAAFPKAKAVRNAARSAALDPA